MVCCYIRCFNNIKISNVMNPKPNPSDWFYLLFQYPWKFLKDIFGKEELSEREKAIKYLKEQI